MTASETAEEKLKNLKPFIGPTHFTREQEHQELFFGRDEETDEIVSLILSHKLVLVYAQSGAGKTSIFEAKVFPTLGNYGLQVLPLARVGMSSDTKIEINSLDTDNRVSTQAFFVVNAFESLMTEKTDSLSNYSLYEFLNHHFPSSKEGSPDIVSQVLIFDQLEELFSFYRGKTLKKQQEFFFRSVAEALEKIHQLRVVFVIREDYLAELDRFVHLLPERLRARFRLERLNEDAAFDAIKGPLEKVLTGVYEFNSDELDRRIKIIVENLSKIRVEEPSYEKKNSEPIYLDGEFVEPIQLQVVLDRGWRKLLFSEDTDIETKKGEIRERFSSKDLEEQIRTLTDVDVALSGFYNDAIEEVVKDRRTNISEKDIRKLFEEKLITSSGTRALVHRGEIVKSLTLPGKMGSLWRRMRRINQ